MRAFTAILKREFFGYFFSPLAWIVLTAFLVINGVLFNGILQALNQPETPGRRSCPSSSTTSSTGSS